MPTGEQAAADGLNSTSFELPIASSGAEGASAPPYFHTYLQQGRAALAEGSPVRAESAFRKSLALEGESALALTGLGVAYDQIGRTDAARANLERAVEFEPDSAIARNNLGVHLWRNGEIDLAIAHLERGAELADNNEVLTRNLELVASMRAGSTFDRGPELSEDDASHEDFGGGDKIRLVERQTRSDAGRHERSAIIRSGTSRFQLQAMPDHNLTNTTKTRYHLYDAHVVPEGL